MSSFGGTIKLSGESEYRKALKDITSNLKLLNSEMKTITTQYDRNDKSASNLSQQNEVLNQKIAEQKEKVNILSQALEKSKSETGENSATTKKWQTELNNAQAELNKLNNQLNKNNSYMEDNRNSYQKLNDTINEQKSRLNDLKSEYGSVVLEQGKNSDKAKELKNEIKNLSGEIKDNENKFRECTNGIDEFTEGENSAGQGAVTLGTLIKSQLISSAIITGVKAVGSAMVEAGKAIINLGKESVAAYANYEQQLGGVETLYGNAADKVVANAQRAYETAGVSMSQYMEMSTSFAAALISSTNSQEEAAKAADMAIINMSDNANKMGTDMASIQNAYQGFAKNNYTMLDNLKLGYGGTKTEMERLLADAEKLTGIKYDINNLSDVYNAINEIQKSLGISGYSATELQDKLKNMSLTSEEVGKVAESMGITSEEAYRRMKNGTLSVQDAQVLLGTTAKEAATTISGSISMTKAAWENLITGLGDPSADVAQLASNVVTSAGFVVSNVIPVINQIVDAIPVAMNAIVSAIAESDLLNTVIGAASEILIGLAEALPEMLEILVSAIMEVFPQITTALIEILPELIESFINMTLMIVEGILAALPQIIDALLSALPQIIVALCNAIPQIVTEIIAILPGLIVQVAGAILSNFFPIVGAVLTGLAQILADLTTWFFGLFGNIGEWLLRILTDVGTWFVGIIGKVGEWLAQTLVNIANWFVQMPGKVWNWLVNVGTQTISWFNQKVSSLGTWLSTFLSNITSWFTSLPGKVSGWLATVGGTIGNWFSGKVQEFFSWGSNLVSGIWEGISGSIGWIKDKISGWVGDVTSFIKNLFGIASPSKLFRDQIGKNLALGIGEGFGNTMKDVSSNMADAIPTQFDTDVTLNGNNVTQFDVYLEAFKTALKDVKVVMSNKEMGKFVIDTFEGAVYS